MLVPIAIPSYRRAATLRSKTLRFLKDSLYPTHLITVFVADESEKAEYLRVIDESLYGDIVVGVKGLGEQRNFISEFYPQGEVICQMDDDISSIKTLKDESFLELVEKGVKWIEGNSGLWGIMPNDDKRRFQDKTTTHLTHIIGSFFLCRNHKTLRINTEEKEDFERSILYFQLYKSIGRFKGAGVTTTYNKGSGGLICDDRQLKMEAGIQHILQQYPGYARISMKGKGRDIILNWRAVAPSDEANSDD